MSTQGKFILIDSAGRGNITFQYFPTSIQTTGRANWEPQDTLGGTKPILYANREPRSITIDDLWLDKTDSGESIEPEIEELMSLLVEEPGTGTPPPLLALWGDRLAHVVLEDVRVEETFFNFEGNPIRAHIGITLLEIRGLEESITVKFVDNADFSDMEQNSQRPVFGPQP